MALQHHPLNREFPQFEAQMRALLQVDGHFARLAEEYDQLDRRIYEAMDGRLAMDELQLQGLKMQRVILKDEIEMLLRKGAAG